MILECDGKMMENNIVKKGLVIAVIVLFIGVSFQPVFAKDTISPIKKSDTKELLETIKDVVNKQEIQSIIQKSEIKGNPIRFQQLLGRLQKEILCVIEKNGLFSERIKQLSDLPCDCEKNNTTRFWNFPFICTLLFPIIYFLGMSVIVLALVFKITPPYFIWHLYEILLLIAYKLNCFFM